MIVETTQRSLRKWFEVNLSGRLYADKYGTIYLKGKKGWFSSDEEVGEITQYKHGKGTVHCYDEEFAEEMEKVIEGYEKETNTEVILKVWNDGQRPEHIQVGAY
jgi:hypothetical protein